LGKITIGYVGQLYQGRGIDLILKLAEKIKCAKFVIIGGKSEDLRYWKSLTERRKIENVKFLGFIPNNQLPQKMREVDIFLMPHQKKVAPSGNKGDIARFTSPMKMFEYMATGKPIVASNLPVLQEVLKHKINCIIVPHDKVGDWQKAVEFLVENPQVAEGIGRWARKEVEQKYTWDLRADKILKLFEKTA
jgi:glycosyltransferase involved in cell wall biosynthesis